MLNNEGWKTDQSHWDMAWRLPRSVVKLVSFGINAMGLRQPLTIEALAPLLVLEVRKGTVV